MSFWLGTLLFVWCTACAGVCLGCVLMIAYANNSKQLEKEQRRTNANRRHL